MVLTSSRNVPSIAPPATKSDNFDRPMTTATGRTIR